MAADALIAVDANVRSDRPILCTGREFGSTGIALHPAYRRD